MARERAMSEARCACGAVGRVLGPDFGYGLREDRHPEMVWRGGRVGAGRLVVEDARAGVTTCPACQHRASVFMLAP